MALTWPPQKAADNDTLRTLKLSVDFYAVDPGTAGDCGIYLLVEHPPTFSPNRKPFVHRAVIIDGGWHLGARYISDFMLNRAGQLYEFDRTQGGRTATPLQHPVFDSIVVTHWDGDHYEGLFTLIAKQLNQDSNSVDFGNPAAVAAFVANYKSPYMKYKEPTDPAGDPRAQTTIYAPYWGNLTVGSRTTGGVRVRTKLSFPPAKQRPFQARAWAPAQPPTYFAATPLDWKVRGNNWVNGLCKMSTGLVNILGLNLFTGLGVGTDANPRTTDLATVRRIRTAQQLALFHYQDQPNPPPLNPAPADAWPVLAIVGGMSREYATGEPQWTAKCVGDTTFNADFEVDQMNLAELQGAYTAAQLDRDGEINSFGAMEPELRALFPPQLHGTGQSTSTAVRHGELSGDENELSSSHGQRDEKEPERPPIKVVNNPINRMDAAQMTNACSLITMVIWTTGQLSCYSAGDANWESELRVACWISHVGINPYNTVRTVKVSHHGAANQTPTALIRTFMPRNIVLMCNVNTAPGSLPTKSYRHPRWELLLWLNVFFAATRQNRIIVARDNTRETRGWVNSCVFPCYITWDARQANYVQPASPGSMDAFMAGPAAGSPIANFQTIVTALIQALAAVPSINYLTTFQTTMLAALDKRRYIIDKVSEAWWELSRIDFNSSYDAFIDMDRYAPTMPLTYRVEFIKTYCRPVDKGRREAADFFIDGLAIPGYRGTSNDALINLVPPGKAAGRFVRTVRQLVLATNQFKAAPSYYSGARTAGTTAVNAFRGIFSQPADPFVGPGAFMTAVSSSHGGRRLRSALVDDVSRPKSVTSDKERAPQTNTTELSSTSKSFEGAATGPVYLVPDFAADCWTSSDPHRIVPSGQASGSPHDPFSVFMSLLEIPVIHVEASGVLSDDDLLGYLLSQVSDYPPSTEQLSVSIKYHDDANFTMVDSVTLDVPATASQTRPALQFSTSTLQGNFAPPGTVQITLPTSGYFPQNSFLALGLTQAAPANWSLYQMLLQVNVDSTLSDSAGAVLEALLNYLQKETGVGFLLQRGVVWFMPAEKLSIQRLQWSLNDSGLSAINNFCAEWLKGVGWAITMKDISIIARRECRRAISQTDWTLTHEHELLLLFEMVRDGQKDDDILITCGLDFNLKDGGTNLIVTIKIDPRDPTKDTSGGGFLEFLNWLVPAEIFDSLNSMIPALQAIKMRSISVNISKSDAGYQVAGVNVSAEYNNDSWKTGNPPLSVPLLLTYNWKRSRPQPHSAQVSVWFEPPPMAWYPAQTMPRYENLYYIRPWTPAASSISLDALMPGTYTLPTELDLEIVQLSLSLEDNTISFTGALQKDPAKDADKHLGITLDNLSLVASYTWHDDGTGGSSSFQRDESSYSIELYMDFSLGVNPGTADLVDEDGEPRESLLSCDVSLTVGGDGTKFFTLIGSIESVSLGQLASFFPDGDSQIVQSLLGHIGIESLYLEYVYDSSGVASHFSIDASLILDVLELDLSFTRDQDKWTFDATLESAGQSMTIGDILNEIMGPNTAAVNDVPDFVKNMDLAAASLHLSLRSDKTVKPDALEASGDASPGTLAMCLALDIPGPGDTQIELAFMQITTKPAPGLHADVTSATKRLVKITLNGIPWNRIPKVPVIDSLKPPFDELGFYWVSDPTWTDPELQPGLTRFEVERLSEISPVVFMDTKPATDPSKPSVDKTPVLLAGWHFLVLDSGGDQKSQASKALLDYLFKKPQQPSSGPKALAAGDVADPPEPSSDANTEDTGTSKAALNKTIGPFTVQNVGLRYKDTMLTLFLDILAHLGPIELDLLGFGIGVDLSSSLQSIVTQTPSFTIQGMGVELNIDIVGAAGLFVERQDPVTQSKMYIGGIDLTIEPYSFLAVGAYGEISPPSGFPFKTVFFFAKLDGPLIELEFVTISGICLGFGYNSSLRFPSVAELPTFPFIQSTALTGDDPLTILSQLTSTDPTLGVVSPKDTSFWLAAGVEGKLVQCISVSAVVVFEFNPYMSLGIFARAIAQMPPAPTSRDESFIYVELGVEATVDFHQGAMVIQAQLSPNSFVITPQCHLSGGFVFCYWFPPSGHAGDFVFSAGGYHSAFRPPPHYPVPERLQISWAVSDVLKIDGQAYFAITPKVCMGGGVLSAHFDAGLLHAWLTAWADALIEYHPFGMLVDIGLEIGVSFTLELLFISIDISVSIGAELTLWAIPFGGSVYVDFWVFGFTIGFGADQPSDQATDMTTFYNLLTQIPGADDPSDGSAKSPLVDKLHVLSVETGLYADDAKDPESKQSIMWQVKRGNFQFRVQTRVPLTEVWEPDFDKTDPLAYTSLDTPFFARPMHLTQQLISTMTVAVTKDPIVGAATADAAPRDPMKFTIVGPVLKEVPKALWDIWPAPSNEDPLAPDDGTLLLMMGATFHAPPPQIAKDDLVPRDVVASLALDVFTDADRPGDGGDGHPSLPPDVVDYSDEWNSAQPIAGDGQWASAQKAWMTPGIVLPTAPTNSPATQPMERLASPRVKMLRGRDFDLEKEAVRQRLAATTPKISAVSSTTNDPSPSEDQDVVNASVVDVTMDMWSVAFGWPVIDDQSKENGLKNELHIDKDGDGPMVWKDFDILYMAAPLIGVANA